MLDEDIILSSISGGSGQLTWEGTYVPSGQEHATTITIPASEVTPGITLTYTLKKEHPAGATVVPDVSDSISIYVGDGTVGFSSRVPKKKIDLGECMPIYARFNDVTGDEYKISSYTLTHINPRTGNETDETPSSSVNKWMSAFCDDEDTDYHEWSFLGGEEWEKVKIKANVEKKESGFWVNVDIGTPEHIIEVGNPDVELTIPEDLFARGEDTYDQTEDTHFIATGTPGPGTYKFSSTAGIFDGNGDRSFDKNEITVGEGGTGCVMPFRATTPGKDMDVRVEYFSASDCDKVTVVGVEIEGHDEEESVATGHEITFSASPSGPVPGTFQWSITDDAGPEVAGTDYEITYGSVDSQQIMLKFLTTGTKYVDVDYTYTGIDPNMTVDSTRKDGATNNYIPDPAIIKVYNVDYVLVSPRQKHCGTGQEVTFTGYAYSNGPDGLRYYNQFHEPNPELPKDDIKLQATFDWELGPGTLGNIYPESNSESTLFTAGNEEDQGLITASYTNPDTSYCEGSARIVVIDSSNVSIDLSGINDNNDIQNVPINAKAPESMDGTGVVGEMKAKVTVTGGENSRFSIKLSYQTDGNGEVNLLLGDSVLFTDGNGVGSKEFIIKGITKSDVDEDIEILAKLTENIPDIGDPEHKGLHDDLAETSENITVYEIKLEKGYAGISDKQLDSRVSGRAPTSDDFELTFPQEWNCFEGKLDERTFLGITSLYGESILVRPEPDNIGGAAEISVVNNDGYEGEILEATSYVSGCEINVVTEPENAYSGKIWGRPYICANVDYQIAAYATEVAGTSISLSVGISADFGIGVSFSVSKTWPNNNAASAVAMAIAGVKYPFPEGAGWHQREVCRHADNVLTISEAEQNDFPLTFSPNNDVKLQVGSNAILFSFAERTLAECTYEINAQAQIIFKGFKDEETQVYFQETGLELIPEAQ